MQKIKYADMHCDTVSVSCNKGGELISFDGQINEKKLKKAGCAVQCFALYTEGENAAADFERYAAYYFGQIKKSKILAPVESAGDILSANASGKVAAVLTVENMGFLKGDASGVDRLSGMGVKMASLVWNNKNEFAYPNLVTKENGCPIFSARQNKGLTGRGVEAVERLNKNRIIIDVSHLSDGGLEDVLSISAYPIVASHSDCDAVCGFFRNLTDEQIKKIADKGGISGINFARDFLGGESVFAAVYDHLIHMINVGGEDFPAFGSDFDGIMAYRELNDCLKMKPLFRYLIKRGIKPRVLEKAALGNFMRVFKEVVG